MLNWFWTCLNRKDIEIELLVKISVVFGLCEICLVVELHQEGSTINGVTPFIFSLLTLFVCLLCLPCLVLFLQYF